MRTQFLRNFAAWKFPLLLAGIFSTVAVFGQSPLTVVNASATSSNQMIWSVGDIYVLPTDPDLTSAGLLGAISQSGLLTVYVEGPQWRSRLQFYPNPTTGRVFVNQDADEVKEVRMYGGDGRHLATWQLATQSIDLSSFPGGVYYLQTDSPQQFTTKIKKL